MGTNTHILILLGMVSCIFCLPRGEDREERFSIFQVIKFENAACKGTSRNGTCFTDQECKARGGTKSGSCADGFGVCCIKMLANGESSNLNMTHISSTGKARTTTITAGATKYTICPASDAICRIRFDFTTFILAGPVTTPGTLANSNGGILAEQAASLGDCTEDQFSIANPASAGTPVICGTNTGQHMIVDSDGVGCSDVHFSIGHASFSRSWDITVLQFECSNEMGGPAGCLQWFTDAKGSVRSFNFPLQKAGAAVGVGVVHLSDQHYKACIRRPAATAEICYMPCTFANPSASIIQSSFGLSISPVATASQSGVDADCTTDFITIRGAAATGATPSIVTRLCGREFQSAQKVAYIATNKSVCSRVVPFEIGVNFDSNEVNAKGGTYATAETAASPGGIIGFSLCYTTA